MEKLGDNLRDGSSSILVHTFGNIEQTICCAKEKCKNQVIAVECDQGHTLSLLRLPFRTRDKREVQKTEI